MIIFIICAAVVIYCAVRFTLIYNTTTGTRWQRMLATARQSATALWLGFVGVVDAAFNGAMQLADMAGAAPEVRDAITKYFDANVASIIIAIVVVLGLAARFRRGSSNPVA